jgi:N-acetylmuramoyl-L-alanine amidase
MRQAVRRIARVVLAFAGLLPETAAAGGATFEAVRVWDAPESTRVVLELSAPVDYQVFALHGPPRIVLDLAGAQLPTSGGYTPAADSPLAAVRFGTPRAGTTRVVLDLRRTQHYQGFLLPPNEHYGYRLVVDLYAQAPDLRIAGLPDLPAGAAPAPVPARLSAPAVQAAAMTPDAGTADPAGAGTPPPRAPHARRPPPRAGAAKPLVIVIDAGHGGEDPGAIGKGGTREKDVVLAIARALAAKIDAQPGMRAVLTRKGDYFLPLRSRVAAAHRADADLFISIHADAAVNRRAQGSGVYALSERGASSEAARLLAAKENAADAIGGVPIGLTDDPMLRSVLLDLSQNATIESGLRLAQDLLGAVRGVNTVHQERVQQAGFVVLKSPHVPSVLVETAFISNPQEERKLRDPAFQARLAGALLAGVREHVAGDPRLATRLAQARAGLATESAAAPDTLGLVR